MRFSSWIIAAVSVNSVYGWIYSKGSVGKTTTTTTLSATTRRSILSSTITATAGLSSSLLRIDQAKAAEGGEDESFASIAARAAKMSKVIESEEERKNEEAKKKIQEKPKQTAYDFKLPVAGEMVPFGDLVKQNENFDKVKAVLVVNMKQDDPIARKDIPEFIALAAKYGREGDFVVVLSPTDQGYFEPDTSALIRLKLASEYGYGINPVTTLTDKVNLLGSGADPFWRWLEGNCRTPDGLGSVQGNFEKFLLDGRTGLPLRRYPRKYMPYDMRDDIEAVLAGSTLPPAGANYREEWRVAAADADRDVYRFQKGLNFFDQ